MWSNPVEVGCSLGAKLPKSWLQIRGRALSVKDGEFLLTWALQRGGGPGEAQVLFVC